MVLKKVCANKFIYFSFKYTSLLRIRKVEVVGVDNEKEFF